MTKKTSQADPATGRQAAIAKTKVDSSGQLGAAGANAATHVTTGSATAAAGAADAIAKDRAAAADAFDAREVKMAEERKQKAEEVTARAAEEGRLPTNSAVANPAPATEMNPSSGAFVERAIIEGVPAAHPSVENNPRAGTSAIQNGQDFNDPTGRDPADPKFAGEGLDLSVYGDGPKPK